MLLICIGYGHHFRVRWPVVKLISYLNLYEDYLEMR